MRKIKTKLLLPCPFCGSVAKLKAYATGWYVACTGTRCPIIHPATEILVSQTYAINLWNTRGGIACPPELKVLVGK